MSAVDPDTVINGSAAKSPAHKITDGKGADDERAVRLELVKKPCAVPGFQKEDAAVYVAYSALCHYYGEPSLPDKLMQVVMRFANRREYQEALPYMSDTGGPDDEFNEALPTGWCIDSDLQEASLLSEKEAIRTKFIVWQP